MYKTKTPINAQPYKHTHTRQNEQVFQLRLNSGFVEAVTFNASNIMILILFTVVVVSPRINLGMS